MANKEQLEILKQGVDVWNKWRKANAHIDANLRETDLNGAKLHGIDLRYTDLSYTDLSYTDLSEARLMGSCLLQANLTFANLCLAHLRFTDFSDANLTTTRFALADFEEANLTNANLTRADLALANFTKANLTNVNLTRANLTLANFTKTNLTNANLTRAITMKADFTGTNLSGARLVNTYLYSISFKNAILINTDFTDSEIENAIFKNNDLGNSIGLERLKHNGPSELSTDTMRKSKGKIPIEFLRGCGLNDLEIQYSRLAAQGLDPEQVTQILYEIHRLYCDQPIQFYSCFISYNSKDQEFAQRLHNDLQNNGVRCWFAPEDMKIGDEFRKAIGKEIRVRDKLLIILSENSIQSEWVGDEVEKALAEEKQQGALKLFPIRLDDAVFNAKDDWTEKIRLRRESVKNIV